MAWVYVLVGAAVGGLVMLVAFAVVLWRKARVLFSELAVLEQHATVWARLAGQVGSFEGAVTGRSSASVD